jgi:hypothetical protein
VLSDEHGIGGDGEYCGDNDAQLDCMDEFFDHLLVKCALAHLAAETS